MDSDFELKLISLIFQLLSPLTDENVPDWDSEAKCISSVNQIIYLVNSTDLDSLPKPETELISLVSRAISVFNTMDLDSQPSSFSRLIAFTKRSISLFESLDLYSEPEPLSKLKLLITDESSLANSVFSYWEFKSPGVQRLHLQPKRRYSSDGSFIFLAGRTMQDRPEPEFMSPIHQIFSLVIPMNSKWNKLISVRSQFQGIFEQGKCSEEGSLRSTYNWRCLPSWWKLLGSIDQGTTHFLCQGCGGENHQENEQAPIEVKHHLHQKHLLQLVSLEDKKETRKCYCCNEDLMVVFYCCSACNFVMNVACTKKPPVLTIDNPKWHDHSLALFPRQASLICELCALADPDCPFYICPPCDFLVHQSCVNLPRVIKISRHPHRLSFTPSFDQGDWSCGVCRKNINNDYGGYSCIKDGCSYSIHSKCATRRNIWDGKDLEGEPEEIEEVLEPFVRISEGIIQHFTHQHHHLRLDDNVGRDYDDRKQCHACITPIYFGNFYSCMQCDYILHETCAYLSRKIHHPIHPHLLTLVSGYDGVMDDGEDRCSTCPWMCKSGFFYECGGEGCRFKLHVQCATISEPLVDESHMHPLFLTSKPGESKRCSICKDARGSSTPETFNCIEECDFSLCYSCATLPQKVRYMHDKHKLTLSYGKETSIMAYWCEACETKGNPKEGFYKCDECCVTLHIECLLGKNLYMKPCSSFKHSGAKFDILPNNHHMSRPRCSYCGWRCPEKVVFQLSGMFLCSVLCTYWFVLSA